MGRLKTRATNSDVAAYIARVEPVGRREDAAVMLALMARVSGYEARMRGDSMIGFGRYDYRYESGHEGSFFRTGFAPRKAKMVVYIMPGYDDYSEPLARLGPYKKGRSCLYLGRLSKVDLGALEEMIATSLQVMRTRYPEHA